MDVEPLDLGRAPKRLAGIVRGQPELRAVLARPDGLVRVGVDPRRDPDERAAHARGAGPLDLLERVEHDEPAGGGGGAQLLVGLVVAVNDEPLARDAGAFREASSPSVETSAPSPSSARSRSTATFGNAFVP